MNVLSSNSTTCTNQDIPLPVRTHICCISSSFCQVINILHRQATFQVPKLLQVHRLLSSVNLHQLQYHNLLSLNTSKTHLHLRLRMPQGMRHMLNRLQLLLHHLHTSLNRSSNPTYPSISLRIILALQGHHLVLTHQAYTHLASPRPFLVFIPQQHHQEDLHNINTQMLAIPSH